MCGLPGWFLPFTMVGLAALNLTVCHGLVVEPCWERSHLGKSASPSTGRASASCGCTAVGAPTERSPDANAQVRIIRAMRTFRALRPELSRLMLARIAVIHSRPEIERRRAVRNRLPAMQKAQTSNGPWGSSAASIRDL